MMMPGRKYSPTNSYRYGFNGQEKSDDVIQGNYTAEYWEYDSRTGRRWNLDPVGKPNESPYATFGGNPIVNIDPNGADTINITRTTTSQKLGGQNDGHSDALVKPSQTFVTQSGSISIQAAKGEDIFKITDVNINIDENGNQTSTSKTTTLELNNKQTFYRTGGHNIKGYLDDRYALAANAPTWLLDYYASKSNDIGVKSAIAYQSDVPFAAGLGKVMNAAYTVTGIYGVARFSLAAALESKTINVFGMNGGYGLFGKNGLSVGAYKIEALYSNRVGVPGGTLLSIKQIERGGNLLRWDYGASHITNEMSIHSSFRINILGNKFGSTNQYSPWAPFSFWKYPTKK
jgi:RHS repeat-associated protein